MMKRTFLVGVVSALFGSCVTWAIVTSTWVIGTRNQVHALRDDMAGLRREIRNRQDGPNYGAILPHLTPTFPRRS